MEVRGLTYSLNVQKNKLFSLLVGTEHSISQILIPDEQGYLLCLIPKARMTKYHNLGA